MHKGDMYFLGCLSQNNITCVLIGILYVAVSGKLKDSFFSK